MAGAAGPVLRMGPDSGPLIVLLPPLFEEANRLRRTLAEIMRGLAARGLASALPDLPGQNESLMPTEAATLGMWRAALAAFGKDHDRPLLSAAFRGGCLIDDALPARAWWRCAPVAGAPLLRTMRRAGTGDWPGGETLFGNRLSHAMIRDLDAAEPAAVTPLAMFDIQRRPGLAQPYAQTALAP